MRSKFLLFLIFAIPLLAFVQTGYSRDFDFLDESVAKLGILGEETSLKSGESVEGSSSYDYEYFMTDTLTWTARMAAESGEWNSVTYGKGLYVAVMLT